MSTLFGEYIRKVNGILYSHLVEIAKLKDYVTSGDEVKSLSVTLEFNDDASIFDSFEVFSVGRTWIQKIAYTYTYTRNSGFSFQYARDRNGENGQAAQGVALIWKPRHHLHVGATKEAFDGVPGLPKDLRGHGGPHYWCGGEMSLDYILAMIIVNFYSSDSNIIEVLDISHFTNG